MTDPVELLSRGEVEVEGRMPWSSNSTFLVSICGEGERCQAVYKPGRGERPLWDFPAGLYRREAAAWRLSEALGWGVVPTTIIRDGPFGEGSFQLFKPSDFEQHYFTIYEHHEDLHDQLRAICAFDIVANNTDRKSGHCLMGNDGRVWAIDNGLCFAEDAKLRTVIWEFGGDPVPEDLLADVARIAEEPPALEDLLDPDEIAAMCARARALVRRPVFPIDTTGHRYPWPLV
jgi:uncharacterized repeat protein (TIGR03843 family)